MDKFIGKTLREIALEREDGPGFFGVSVHLLEDENDETGKQVAENFSLKYILQDHPELADARLVRYNYFFGQSVLRVIKDKEAN